MTSHRQLRTPLYGGRPFWWGDDDVSGPDALTNKSTLAPVSRVEHKLLDQSTASATSNNDVDITVTSCTKPFQGERSGSSGSNSSRCDEQRHDGVVASSAHRLPAVSFTVSLDGCPIDLSSSLSQYFPARKQRQQTQLRLNDQSPQPLLAPRIQHRCPVTSRESRHGNNDDAVSEAGTYVVESPLNFRLQRQRMRPARSFSSLSMGSQTSSMTSAMTQARYSKRVLRRSLPRLPCDDVQNEAKQCYGQRWERDVISSNSTARRRPNNNGNNHRNFTTTTRGCIGVQPMAIVSKKDNLKKTHETTSSTEIMNRKNLECSSSKWHSVGTDVLLTELDSDDCRNFTSADSQSPVDSRDDFRYSYGSGEFETSRGYTGRSDASLDAAIRLRDSPLPDSSSGDVDHVSPSSSPPRSARTSRTLASVDTNILLDSTEAVVAALARGRHTREDHQPSHLSAKANTAEETNNRESFSFDESDDAISVTRNPRKTTQEDVDADKTNTFERYTGIDLTDKKNFSPSSSKPDSEKNVLGDRTSSTLLSSNASDSNDCRNVADLDRRPIRQATATKSRSSFLSLEERDERCLVNYSLVSSAIQLSSIVTAQADQLVASLQRTLKLRVDSFAKPLNSRVTRTNNGIEADMLDVLDNLEAAGHQLIAVNKVLATLSVTNNNNGMQRRNHIT